MKRIATTLLIAGLLATPLLAVPPPAAAGVSVGISIGIAPPLLPVYAQPVAPAPGYIWTPGYWAWAADGYYWVPGTWVIPPAVGLLWTPGWWGWSAGYYRWHAGYWGPRVGFYGGINYGFGYFGAGYVGGYWRGRDFYYNRAVNNINVTNVRNVYINKTVINNIHVTRVSYNGAQGGVMARPTAAQRSIARERRFSATSMQTRQRELALRNPTQHFRVNQGRPAVFATQRAGNFDGPHAVREASAPRARMAAATGREHDFSETRRAPAQPMRMDESPRAERLAEAREHGNAGPQAARQRSQEARRQSSAAREKRRGKPEHGKQEQGKQDHGKQDHARR